MSDVDIILGLSDRVRGLEEENRVLKERLELVSGNIPVDFKQRRLAKGYTLRQVEELTGISNAYLSQVENNKIKNPSFKVVQALNNLYQ